jgi:hypothetical protein
MMKNKNPVSVAGTCPSQALAAAQARIDAIPAGATLIDAIPDALWQSGEEGSIEVGSSHKKPEQTC